MLNVNRDEIKKAFLYSLVISVAFSAILGIYVILDGSWGWFQLRVLLTTFTISAASICGLANGAFLASKRGTVLPMTGIALTLIGAVLFIGAVWMEGPSEFGEIYLKFAFATAVFAVACGHLSLLSMTRLAPEFRWSLVVAYVIVVGIASLIVLLILAVPHVESPVIFRVLAVGAILDAMMTVLVPIFHVLSKSRLPMAGDADASEQAAAIDQEIDRLKERIAELERKKRELDDGLVGSFRSIANKH